ncbi:LIM domain protein [Ancylostoma ceylanicum]|uniref:FXNA-like protease n=1 Tax=Ancylostoma ceylanicum TaxID=53326 RepID=A0A0D6M6A0_9BILA|nr:LIM domain protein [Ancylostoma ceylanicum]
MWIFKKRDDNGLMPVDDSSISDKEDNEFRARHWIVILLFLIALMATSVYFHKALPDPLPADKDNSRFSELRARRLLFELSNFGPKPAGSDACERLTRNHILQELEIIKTSASVRLEVSKQNPSGCFDIPRFDTDGFTICYRNVSNVAVRLSKNDGNQNRVAVLLNCHYDSWPTSSGGSDDLISCALMMELIRLLAHQPDSLKHDVIFLFNGAEESSLQGAHGFITQHAWRHVVRAFINLEASGSGGRELLFQAGPSNQWLLNSYLAAAVHPHCSIIGQEVFQSGVFPGDTDFRVFRDYGRVPGLDLAFVQNGYWWHTEFDEARRITPGSLQRAGDNIYATLLYLLQSPYLDNPAEFGDQKNVFFDFLGLFVVVYSEGVANAVNAILVVAVVISTGNHMRKHSDVYKTAVTNYVLESAEAIENVHLVFNAVLLALCTFKGVASGFVFALVLLQVVKQVLPLTTEWRAVIAHLILNTPSYGMVIYLTEMFLSIFIPIMGRTGSNPEILVAACTNLTSYVVVLSLHVNRALYNKDDGVKVRDSLLYVIAQDYRGAMDIPFVDESRHIRYRSFDDRPDVPGTKINLVHKEEGPNRLSYDFLIKGSGQISVFLIPQGGWQIANCSISAPKTEMDDRPLFLFLTCSGRNCGDWTFKVTLKHPGDPVKDDDTQLLVGVASHYLHGPNMQSWTIKRILGEIVKNRQYDPAWSITASAWNTFHVKCFKCSRCNKKLAGFSTFYRDGDKPICEVCYQDTLDKCKRCRKPITGRMLRADEDLHRNVPLARDILPQKKAQMREFGSKRWTRTITRIASNVKAVD